jgi:hypothetical protein
MTSSYPLPPDLLESQISTLDLLLAMFPDENEFEITPSDLALITSIRDNGSDGITSIPSEIHLALHVSLDLTHSTSTELARESQCGILILDPTLRYLQRFGFPTRSRTLIHPHCNH